MQQQQQPDRTVYVGNIAKDTVDETALRTLFSHCGQVTQVRIAGDPTYDTRYAFVEFTTVAEAATALMLDGMTIFEHVIRVSMARGGSGPGIVRSNDPDRVQRTIHVGGLPFEEISEDMLADYFANVGEVNAVRKSGRFAWVEFASLSSAQQALSLDGESMGTGTLKVSASKTPIHTAGWRAAKYRDSAEAPGASPPALPPGLPPPQTLHAPPPPMPGGSFGYPQPYGYAHQPYPAGPYGAQPPPYYGGPAPPPGPPPPHR